MKQRLKKRMSFLLVLSLLLGLLPPLAQSTVESLGAQIVVNGTRFTAYYTDCPHGGTHGRIAAVGCSVCGGTGVNWDKDEYVKEHKGKYSGNDLHPGPGWQTDEKPIDSTHKKILYYRCKNCGVCAEYSKLIKTVYYREVNGNWVLDTTKGKNGTGVEEPSNPASASSGHVPRRWCTICGPLDAGYVTASYTLWHWPRTYTLNIEAGTGGNVSLNNKDFKESTKAEYEKGKSVNVYAKPDDGYTFKGWYTNPAQESSSKSKEKSYNFKMPGEDYKLTAVFEKTEEFTLTLKVCSGCDDCGGIQNQIIDSKTQFATNGGKYVKGTEVSLEVKITEDKSKFVKWTVDTGPKTYDGSTLTSIAPKMTEDTTLVAHFVSEEVVTPAPKAITVTFDAKGGTVSPNNKKVYVGGEYGDLPTPVYDGFNFTGWFYNNTQIYDYTKVEEDKDHTLIAKYTAGPTPEPTASPTPEPTPEPTPDPHVCVFGPWQYHTKDEGNDHWKECVCGKRDSEGIHDYQVGDTDQEGSATYTCKDCGYSYTEHGAAQHEWAYWYPTCPYGKDYEYSLSDYDFTEVHPYNAYDATKYHWKACIFDGCTRTIGKEAHVKGLPENVTGISFANQLGLTTQMPAVIEVVTNREATNGRTITLVERKLIS